MDVGFIIQLVVAAPSRHRQLVLHASTCRGTALAILGLQRVGGSSTLRFLYRDPLFILLDLSKLPMRELVVGICSDRFVQKR